MLERLGSAYRSNDLPGAYLTAPLKRSLQFLATPLGGNQKMWERVAWRIARFVATVASPFFALLAGVGIGVNLYFQGKDVSRKLTGVQGVQKELVAADRRAVLEYWVRRLKRCFYDFIDPLLSINPWYIPVKFVQDSLRERIEAYNFAIKHSSGYSGSSEAASYSPSRGSSLPITIDVCIEGEVTPEQEELLLEQMRNFSITRLKVKAYKHPKRDQGFAIRFYSYFLSQLPPEGPLLPKMNRLTASAFSQIKGS